MWNRLGRQRSPARNAKAGTRVGRGNRRDTESWHERKLVFQRKRKTDLVHRDEVGVGVQRREKLELRELPRHGVQQGKIEPRRP